MNDSKLESSLSRILSIYSYDDISVIFASFVNALAYAVSEVDGYTGGHQLRVSNLSDKIAREMDFDEEQLENIYLASRVHDIGKIRIPAAILTRVNPLLKAERDLIEQHTLIGFDILKRVQHFVTIPEIVKQHHERLNGSGYPDGLKGSDILIQSQIVAVADVVEAMTNERPYRHALGLAEALDEIEKNKGILYDKNVCDTCGLVFRKGFTFDGEL